MVTRKQGTGNARAARILAIETSCDETSVAIVRVRGTDVRVLHHETATQIPIHARYGGVVPEIAARMHVAETVSLLDRASVLKKGRCPYDAIAVTRGPGLATALRVGIEAGRTLAFISEKPFIGVNHLEGHLASSWLIPSNRKRWTFPILFLLVSGGHSELVLMKEFRKIRVLGRTRDDAAGEAFDKTAKLMGLGYPGGPAISMRAKDGNPTAFDLPRPMLGDASLDFSFSGFKSAVRRVWEGLSDTERSHRGTVSDLCASVEQAIVDVLVEKTIRAALKVKPAAIAVVGGVSANQLLQFEIAKAVTDRLPKVTLLEPASGFHTDNAAMIAAAASWRLMNGETDDWKKVDAKPEWDL